MKNAGGNLLSRWTHYHWPRVLIGRVRDGNGSFHPGMATGKFAGLLLQQAVGLSNEGGRSCRECLSGPWSRGYGSRGGVVKRLAVSTGRLRALLHLHVRPIDPVVFREPSWREA